MLFRSFIGPKTHVSARYVIRAGEASETQSSSGVVVSTGLGSTGWLKSLLTGAAAIAEAAGVAELGRRMPASPRPASNVKRGKPSDASKLGNFRSEFEWDSDSLVFTVREPFPAKTSGASIVFGRVTASAPLILESRMAENGVVFSDGIESDFLEFNSGTQAAITVAERKGALVV